MSELIFFTFRFQGARRYRWRTLSRARENWRAVLNSSPWTRALFLTPTGYYFRVPGTVSLSVHQEGVFFTGIFSVSVHQYDIRTG